MTKASTTEIAMVRLVSLPLVLLLLTCHPAGAQRPGDDWTQVRGDTTPGVYYTSFVRTPFGRWLAAGANGQLMYSDDAGATWEYDVIRDESGKPVFGLLTEMVVFENEVVGVLIDFVASSNRFGLPFEGRTRLLYSRDNGNSWRIEEFPIKEAFLGGFPYPGILLPRLFVSPAGELLAYGATAVGRLPVMIYRGGAVFRRTAPGQWAQAYFENGPLASMAEANGRLVASGFQAVIDSPDGRTWGGYQHEDGAFAVEGMDLPRDTLRALNGSDIAFIGGRYVMQTQAFTPIPGRPNLFRANVDRAFIFESGNPFDGGRRWTGDEQTRVFHNWTRVDDALLSLSPAGAFRSLDGDSWTLADDTVRLSTRSLGPVGGRSVVAVGNSREVWRSDDAGSTWTKILDLPQVPNVNLFRRVGDVLYGQVCNFSCNELYASLDNGVSWSPLANLQEQTGVGISDLVAVGDRLFAVQGFPNAYAVSTDGGLSWTALETPFRGAGDLVVGEDGRLIRPSGGASGLTGLGTVYTSDDDGATWQERSVDDIDREPMKDGVNAGGGRILFMYNVFGGLGPALFVSDDNGTTWRRENPFEGLPGLGTTASGAETVIDLVEIERLASGRLVLIGGGGEILTSDDRGASWTVRVSYNVNRGPGEPFLSWRVYDIAETAERIVIPASRRDPQGGPDVYLAFVSEDDGTSWREVPVPSTVTLRYATAGLNGRVVLSGSNGAIFVSDFARSPTGEPAEYSLREGETRLVPVPRPPADGALTLRYALAGETAEAGADFADETGELTWAQGETEPKLLELTALDDAVAEDRETFLVRFSLEDDVVLQFAYRVTIDDNEAGDRPGLALLDADDLETSEGGTSDQFRVALATPPTADVTVTIVQELVPTTKGAGGELEVTPTALVFTPGDWNVAQTVTVTGTDDGAVDADVAVRLRLQVESDDEDYGGLIDVSVYVVNRDDDMLPLVFRDGFENAPSAGD